MIQGSDGAAGSLLIHLLLAVMVQLLKEESGAEIPLAIDYMANQVRVNNTKVWGKQFFGMDGIVALEQPDLLNLVPINRG